MCWTCEQDKSVAVGDWQNAYGAAAAAALHYKAYDARYDYGDAFVADGVGDKTDTVAGIDIPLLTLDTIPADTTTTQVLTVGGPRIVSTINTPGDQDWFKIELEAGQSYEFGQYLVKNGPTGIPLADAYIELYDSEGTLLAASDGGGPFTPSGLDALLNFRAEESGTYYINARSFDQAPEDGTDGELVGDYEVFARTSSYTPYYDLDSPLHSLDWGTQFDGTSRNPDGDRGTRPDGLEVENKIGGKNVISVYFARQGDIFVDNGADPTNLTTTMVAKGMQQWEKDSFNAVFSEFEKVADIDYVETDDRYAADIVVITYNGTPGPGVSLLGRMSPPDTAGEGQTEYNAGDERWTEAGLKPGGFYFGTLIHEFGHGHGMSHPHDNGGRSSIMRDSSTASGYVEETSPLNYTLGDGNLNQSVYTMMSYMDGWQLSPYGNAADDAGYGYIGSLMALDIAVIQDKYGVNEDWARGDDTYTLKDVNAAGTFYSSIWDGAGTDRIVYSGSKNANIDLRPATLQYEEGGGGFISYAFGIFGGFTIANGVTVENATSGSGNDTLTGNDVANVLNGGLGNDKIDGRGGNDTASYEGVTAGVRVNLLMTGAQETKGAGLDELISIENVTGGSGADTLNGSNVANVLSGGAGNDLIKGRAGDDVLSGGAGDDMLLGGDGNDTASYAEQTAVISVTLGLANAQNSGAGMDTLSEIENLIGGSNRDIFYGDGSANVLAGMAGNDRLFGNAGDDMIAGGAGMDKLWGGAGNDIFVFHSASDSAGAAMDQVNDFVSGADKLDFSLIDANSATTANDGFSFIGGNAFTNAAGQLRSYASGGSTFVEGDVNGDGVADFSVQLMGTVTPIMTDFIL